MLKAILCLALLVTVRLAFSQSNCFENCFSNFEKAKSSTLLPADGNDINERILKGLVGCKAPDFAVKTITGDTLKLEALKGKVVVLNFWFIGCAPCVAELPALNRLVDEYKGNDVVFIAFGRDTPTSINAFLKKHEFNYKVVSSEFDFANKYCIIAGWPTSMVLDKNGVVRKVFSGGYIDERATTHAYNQIKPVIDESRNK